MRHADFPVDEVDPKAEGPTFTLAGETFRCLPEMPAGAFLSLLDQGSTFSASGMFIRGCLVREDEARFDAVISGKERVVVLSRLPLVSDWLLSEAWEPEPPKSEAEAP